MDFREIEKIVMDFGVCMEIWERGDWGERRF